MNLNNMKLLSLLLSLTLIISGCSVEDTAATNELKPKDILNVTTEEDSEQTEEETDKSTSNDTSEFNNSNYTEVSSDSCSLSGGRVENAKVDIGYDSDYATRDYFAYTNEYGQLVHVEADEIILQNDDEENNGEDRYCSDEAKVPGVEQSDLDEGHMIADSLGGASNAYNITPQGSHLNRYGTQAEIEGDIRDNGGATNFSATIEYPNTNTQIPSTYTISYTVNGTDKSETFANDYTPDGETKSTTTEEVETTTETTNNDSDVYYENCTAVREAGASPIHSGDPGYSTKLDRDGDGVGCE